MTPPTTQSHGTFIFNVLSIIVVDLTLRGDNAVVIAAAVRTLPVAMRKRALIGGAAGAIVTLVIATFFATRLLSLKFVQLIGGFVILWIAIGLFRKEVPLQSSAEHVTNFWKAMWLILAADVTMSADNILAIAAIAQGNLGLLLFGLAFSIPLVVLASSLLATLMDKFPAIVYLGAALLGRVAGHMIMTDAWVAHSFAPSNTWIYSVEAALAAGVLIAGRWLKSRG